MTANRELPIPAFHFLIADAQEDANSVGDAATDAAADVVTDVEYGDTYSACVLPDAAETQDPSLGERSTADQPTICTHLSTWGDSSNPPLILLHGFMQRGTSWEPLASELSRDHWVVAPDLIGHGKTTAPLTEETFSFETHVAQLASVVQWVTDRAGAKPIVWGYSMGGRIAAAFACEHPDAPSGLIIESCGLGLPTEEERTARQAIAAKQAQMLVDGEDGPDAYTACRGLLESTASLGSAKRPNIAQSPDAAARLSAFVDYWESLPLFASQKTLPQDIRENQRVSRLANNPDALALSLLYAGQHAMPYLVDCLADLSLAMLFIHGELDAKYSALATKLSSQGVSTACIKNAGHNTHLEQPAAIMDTVQLFFGKNYT